MLTFIYTTFKGLLGLLPVEKNESKVKVVLPKSQLRVIMVKVLRRLRNCSRGDSWDEKVKTLTDFANNMRCSGHNGPFRQIVFDKPVARYEKEL